MGARTLVAGATGQVGTQMLQYLRSTRGAHAVLPTTRHVREGWHQLDFATLAEVTQAATLFDRETIDSIYCVAGMTNVDACEDDEALAFATNARGPSVLAKYARQRAVPFVYFSTEYVFDGSRERPGPYGEEDAPAPLNVYGRSKLAGEAAVLEANPDALVLRTTVVYGPDAREKNYLYSLMRNLSKGVPMRVPEDQISTPTYNLDLIRAALGLVEAQARGTFHVCGPELLSRMAFAEMVAEALGLDGALLQPVTTAELGQRAPRPLAAGLATGKLVTLYPRLRMRPVREAVEECLAEFTTFLTRQREIN